MYKLSSFLDIVIIRLDSFFLHVFNVFLSMQRECIANGSGQDSTRLNRTQPVLLVVLVVVVVVVFIDYCN